jgi:1,2-phenylacetyl-CoA epoxidase catalytic subunit
LEYADRIGTTNWTRLGPNLPATGTVMTIQDNTAGQTQRFYRVLLVP